MALARVAAGLLASAVALAALAPGWASSALADDTVTFSGNADLTTDYVFRGITQTGEAPAGQAEFDVTYKMFYFGMWGSNVDFGSGPEGQNLAEVEVDYYAGVTPSWGNYKFDFGAYGYTYPGAFDPDGNFSYLEIKTGVSRTWFDKLTLGIINWYAPRYSGDIGTNDVVEWTASWAFDKWWVFTPGFSATFGHQWGEPNKGGTDYSYWNAGLTLGFNKKPPLSLDLRYWDTAGLECPDSGVNACHARFVASLKASF